MFESTVDSAKVKLNSVEFDTMIPRRLNQTLAKESLHGLMAFSLKGTVGGSKYRLLYLK